MRPVTSPRGSRAAVSASSNKRLTPLTNAPANPEGAFFFVAMLRRESPCKINLLLNILGRRPDGFHELETLFHHVPLTDELRFARAGAEVVLTCNDPALPVDGTNLVHRAATRFLAAAGLEGSGVRLHLEKRLPLAAGLGGGSANAAHTLLGLNELFGHPLSAAVLDTLAAGLGSDVNFFLQDRPALATGRGEHVVSLEPFAALKGTGILLVHPGFGVATPWAFAELKKYPAALAGRPGRAAELAELLRQGDLTAAGNALYNSLEAPVLDKYPVLRLYQEFFRRHGAWGSLMSGSGSTTFALFATPDAAQAAVEPFQREFGPAGWLRTTALAA